MPNDIPDWTNSVQVAGGSVTITGTANVAITNTPSVTISGTPNVSIANTPAVTVNSGTINIGNTPTVILGAGSATVGAVSAINSTVTVAGTINIGNTPSVTISGTPTVNIGNTPSVTVSGTPNVNITQSGGFASVTYGPNLLTSAQAGPISSGWTGAQNFNAPAFNADGTMTLTVTAGVGASYAAGSRFAVTPGQTIHGETTMKVLDNADDLLIAFRSFDNAGGFVAFAAGASTPGVLNTYVTRTFDYLIPSGVFSVETDLWLGGGGAGTHTGDRVVVDHVFVGVVGKVGVAGVVNINAVQSTVTVSISGTPTVNIGNTPAVTISGTPSVTISSGTVSISGTPNINILSQSVTLNAQLVTASTTGTLVNVNDAATLTLNGSVSVAVLLTGGAITSANTIACEASPDNSHWVGIPAQAYPQGAGQAGLFTVPVIAGASVSIGRAGFSPAAWRCDVAGFQQFRIRKTISDGTSATFALFGTGTGSPIPPLSAANYKDPGAVSVAQAASMTLWTPSSVAVRWNVMLLMVAADATGELQLNDGSQFASIDVITRQPVVIPYPPPGLQANGVNQALKVVNNTGGTTGLHAMAMGYESQ